LYLNLQPDRYHLIEAYALSSHILLILFTAWAAALWAGTAPEDGTGLSGRKGREWFAFVLVLLLLLPSAGWRVLKQRQDRNTFSYDYCLNVWRGIPRGSVFFARGDSIIFPGWFFQWVEGRRTDLSMIGVDGLPMKWVRVVLKRMHPDLKVPFPETQVPFVGNESIPPMTRFLYYSNKDQEKYFSYNKIEDGSVPEVRLVPSGLAYRGVVPPPGVTSPPIDEPMVHRLWASMRLRNLGDHGKSQDERTRANLLKDYAVIRNGMGVYYEDMADEVKLNASKAKKPAPEALLASLYQNCYVNFIWASEWFDTDNEFAFNVGNALFNLGRTAESTQWYEKSVKLDPTFDNAYFNWAVAEYQMAQYQKAGELFEKVLKLDPQRKEASGALEYMKFQGWYRPKAF
jgi:hypothetical protein